MRFSYSKAAVLRPQKEKGLSTFLIAIFLAASFFVPYMILSDGYFTFYGDFNVQQIPFYKLCHEAIREGNIFWSHNTDLGANFIGSYSFYLLGSPFFWITLPIPTEIVPYFMGPLLILKFGLAALTAYFYIRRFTRTSDAARLGGILYAFSGFSIYNVFFNHFHEAIIIFPLLLLAVELFITENRRFAFAITVCACAVINYYFFFGMVVFTVIYFFVRLFTGAIKIKFSRFLAFAFEAVLGLALSAFILLPALLAIVDNSRISSFLNGWSGLMYGKEQIYGNILQCFFFPPDIPARAVFFPEAQVNWSSLGGWLPVFSVVGLFTWFSKRKNTWVKTLLGICIFLALVPVLNSAFSFFNEAYYARWFYMPILIMCMATVSLTEDSTVDWKFGYKWVFGITVAIALTIGLFPRETEEGKIALGVFTRSENHRENLMYTVRYWIACAIAIASLVILGLLLKLIKKNQKTFWRAALACVCIVTTVYANVFMTSGYLLSFDVDNVIIPQLINGKVELEGDKDDFRIDVYGGPDNVAMFLGYSGINAFHSIVPPSVFEFYEYVGQERIVGSRPDTSAYALRSLLSVKYLLNSKHLDNFADETGETLMPGYKYLKTENDYYVYENENYVPYGFSYEYYMTEEFCDAYEPSQREEMLLKAILLTDEQVKKYGYMLKDLGSDESVSYLATEGTSLLRGYENMQYDCKKLAETSAEYFQFDNKGFTAKVTREKENLVFFSIPYDKGWTATVNGKKAEIEKVNKGFMAVKVDKGTSEIRFDYMTPGLPEGITITCVSAAIFLIYVIIFILWNIKHKKAVPYPEGEKLLKEWHRQELIEIKREQKEKERQNKPSLLDIDTDFSVPQTSSDFADGFKIDTEAFKEDN